MRDYTQANTAQHGTLHVQVSGEGFPGCECGHEVMIPGSTNLESDLGDSLERFAGRGDG
jgi:hypothetical protein